MNMPFPEAGPRSAKGREPGFGSPAIVNGRVYFGSTDGIFYVLTAAPR